MTSKFHASRSDNSEDELARTPSARLPAVGCATAFARQHCARLAAISAVLIVPCFWHRRIEAGDLGSHVYNAWLVQLIQHGQAPGLWIARQWSNVCFDHMLTGLARVVGLRWSEKIAVAIAVLILFWGTFAVISAAMRRAPWSIVPVLAMVAYGWTFHAGFFNYYLSIGLSFLGLALFWNGSVWERLIAVALAPLIYLAHPLGVIWLLGACIYVGVAQKLKPRYHALLLLIPAFFLVGLHFYLSHHYNVSGVLWPLYLINGADQFVLFGHRYMFVYFPVLLFALIGIGIDIRERRLRDAWSRYAIALQLYILVELGAFLLPNVIQFPGPGGLLGYLVERLSLVSAILAACLLGGMRPQKWHAMGFGAIALVFFAFVYQDTAILNSMEEQVERLVSTLPPGQRVMETVLPDPQWRIKFINHMVDRACIGRCFAYGNYEPSAEQFRVRSIEGNKIVMNWSEDMGSMESGDYEVQEADLPAYQIYQCSSSVTELCIRQLEAGEQNDRLGIHPNHQP